MILSAVNWVYRIPQHRPDKWWKIRRLKQQCMHFRKVYMRNRVKACFIFLRRGYVHQTKGRLLKAYAANKLRHQRLEGACQEYEIPRHVLQSGLISCGVKLNSQMLVILSIYEPSTFAKLIELSQRAGIEKIYRQMQPLPERTFLYKAPEPRFHDVL